MKNNENLIENCDTCFDTKTIDQGGREIQCPDCKPAAPSKRSVKFQAANVPDGGFLAGDERSYDVLIDRRYAGVVERGMEMLRDPEDESKGWTAAGFDATIRHADGTISTGEGRTRYAAVAACFA